MKDKSLNRFIMLMKFSLLPKKKGGGTKKKYDKGVIQEGGADGGWFQLPMDIFSMFFGGGRRMQTGKRGQNGVHRLSVTLKDLCNGTGRKLAGSGKECDLCWM